MSQLDVFVFHYQLRGKIQPISGKLIIFSPNCVSDEVFRNQDQGTPASNRTVSAADVVLYGVNIVLPLMSQDLLKVKPHSMEV